MASHRLVINIVATAAGSSAALTFDVSAEEADRAIARLADTNGVLRFKTGDNRGRQRTETLIPVRAVTHVDHSFEE